MAITERRLPRTMLVLAGVLLTAAAPAVSPPKPFTSGTKIVADDVNANFTSLANAITALEQPTAALSDVVNYFETTSVSPVPVPGLSVSITTSANECVKYEVLTVACVNPADQGTYAYDTKGSGNAKGEFAVLRDDGTTATVVGRAFTMAAGAYHYGTAHSLGFLDVPPAGAHTYTVEVKTEGTAGWLRLGCLRAMATRVRCQ